eukprot:SAG11_NODE_16276_length_552_cov_1.136865_1_plen_61_part_00
MVYSRKVESITCCVNTEATALHLDGTLLVNDCDLFHALGILDGLRFFDLLLLLCDLHTEK